MIVTIAVSMVSLIAGFGLGCKWMGHLVVKRFLNEDSKEFGLLADEMEKRVKNYPPRYGESGGEWFDRIDGDDFQPHSEVRSIDGQRYVLRFKDKGDK